MYIIQSRKSFCASPSCRPGLRPILQSLGLAQKTHSTLNDIITIVYQAQKVHLFRLSLSFLAEA
jgi:hypothetical protein